MGDGRWEMGDGKSTEEDGISSLTGVDGTEAIHCELRAAAADERGGGTYMLSPGYPVVANERSDVLEGQDGVEEIGRNKREGVMKGMRIPFSSPRKQRGERRESDGRNGWREVCVCVSAEMGETGPRG